MWIFFPLSFYNTEIQDTEIFFKKNRPTKNLFSITIFLLLDPRLLFLPQGQMCKTLLKSKLCAFKVACHTTDGVL